MKKFLWLAFVLGYFFGVILVFTSEPWGPLLLPIILATGWIWGYYKPI